MKSLFKIPALAALVQVSLVSSAAAYDVTVKSGQTIGLLNASIFSPLDCKAYRANVVTVKAPQNGKLWAATGILDPKDANDGHSWFSNRCYGQKMKSTRYYYRSRAGFRGQETVILRQTGGDGDAVYRFTITVKWTGGSRAGQFTQMV